MKRKFYANKNQRLRALGQIDPSLENIYSDQLFQPLPFPKRGDWLSQHPQPGQTFKQYISYRARKPNKASQNIIIQPLNQIPHPLLQYLYQFCQAFFHGIPVLISQKQSLKKLKISNRVHMGLKQYHAGQILRKIRSPKGGFCIIAVTMQDLYPQQDWNFVYGLADGNKGVFSFCRYWNKERDPEGVSLKLMKKAGSTMVHEIGHMFGIQHCVYYRCLMNGSNGAGESAGGRILCPVCLKKLWYSVEFDHKARYEALAAVCQEVSPKACEDYVLRISLLNCD